MVFARAPGAQCLAAALCVLAAACCGRAYGWGAEGHRITGHIASQLLTPKARAELERLVPGGELADLANYMDVFREALKTEVPGSDKWHYDNRPVCRESMPAQYCIDGHCASARIPQAFAALADVNRPDADRAQALKFLVHMAGDIHQPLHAADDDDLGGNRKQVVLPGAVMARNLHAVWDNDLVKQTTRGRPEAEVAREYLDRYRRHVAVWQRGDVGRWMGEGYRYARRIVYGRIAGFTCGMQEDKRRGLLNGKPWPEPIPLPLPLPGETPPPIPVSAVPLTPDYVATATRVLPYLLTRAGVRIAWLLNRALDPTGTPAVPPLAEEPDDPVDATLDAPAADGNDAAPAKKTATTTP